MKASEADQFKQAPRLPDMPLAAPGGHAHGGGAEQGGGHGEAGGHEHGLESIRTATHCGHEIVIKTCYEITVDGKPLAPHMSVNDDGSLNTHALPEYTFSSAVDVVKKIIDAYPDEYPCDEQGHDHSGKDSSSDQQGHGHGGHTHEHT